MEPWINWWSSWNAFAAKLTRGLALLLILFYRSTLALFMGGTCRFEPSCSCYAQQAFEKHPPVTAFRLSLQRLLKCHPLGSFGFDPVPEPRGKST